jgi:hypothetical protein
MSNKRLRFGSHCGEDQTWRYFTYGNRYSVTSIDVEPLRGPRELVWEMAVPRYPSCSVSRG